MQIDKHSVGYFTYNGGLRSLVSTSVVRDTEFGLYNFAVQIGVPSSYVSFSYTKKMINRELRFKLSVKYDAVILFLCHPNCGVSEGVRLVELLSTVLKKRFLNIVGYRPPLLLECLQVSNLKLSKLQLYLNVLVEKP